MGERMTEERLAHMREDVTTGLDLAWSRGEELVAEAERARASEARLAEALWEAHRALLTEDVTAVRNRIYAALKEAGHVAP